MYLYSKYLKCYSVLKDIPEFFFIMPPIDHKLAFSGLLDKQVKFHIEHILLVES